MLETEYGGQVIIRGQNFYRGGKTPGIYKEGAQANIAIFHSSIVNGVYDNPTVKPSVQSNLVSILGRNSADNGEPLFWYQLQNNSEQLAPELKGLKD